MIDVVLFDGLEQANESCLHEVIQLVAVHIVSVLFDIFLIGFVTLYCEFHDLLLVILHQLIEFFLGQLQLFSFFMVNIFLICILLVLANIFVFIKISENFLS